MINLPIIDEKPEPINLPNVREERQIDGGTPSPAPTHTSLIDVAAYWKFDDGPSAWVDSVGSNDFAATGTIQQETGALNGAAHSDGQFGAGYLQAADSAILGAGPGVSFSYSLWVKVLPAGGGSQDNLSGGRPIFSKITTGVGGLGEYGLSHDNGLDGLTFQARQGDNSSNALVNAGPSSTPPAADPFWDAMTGGDGNWHHVCCGYDDDAQELWIQIDDGHRYTSACVGVHRDASKLLTIFQFSDLGFGGYFWIDEMGLWKRLLTTGEVTLLNNGGTPKPLSTF